MLKYYQKAVLRLPEFIMNGIDPHNALWAIATTIVQLTYGRQGVY